MLRRLLFLRTSHPSFPAPQHRFHLLCALLCYTRTYHNETAKNQQRLFLHQPAKRRLFLLCLLGTRLALPAHACERYR
jgi:hypothetical protein